MQSLHDLSYLEINHIKPSGKKVEEFHRCSEIINFLVKKITDNGLLIIIHSQHK